jgi:DNA-binding transcriptional LysR family regulator
MAMAACAENAYCLAMSARKRTTVSDVKVASDVKQADLTPTDWEDLRFFLQLARSGNLSEAARRLRVNHTTVARRIARLERDLGVTLFDRGPRGYDVTSQAAKLVEHAERMEGEIDALHRRLSGDQIDLAGTVRITTIDSFATYLLLPALPRFHQRYPMIDVELISANYTLNLTRREADMALRLGRPRDTGLVSRKLTDIPYFLYGATGAVRALKAKCLADLADQRFLAYDTSMFNVAQEDWLDHTIRDRRIVFRTNTLEPLLTAAREGLGFVMLAAFVGDRDPGLARVPIREAMPARELWLLVHGELRRSPRIRATLDFVIDLVGRERARLSGTSR